MNGLARGPGPCVSRRFSALNAYLSRNSSSPSTTALINNRQYNNNDRLTLSPVLNLLSGKILFFRLNSKLIDCCKRNSTKRLVDGAVLSFVGPQTAVAPSLSSVWSQ